MKENLVPFLMTYLREWFPDRCFKVVTTQKPVISGHTVVAFRYEIPEREIFATDAQTMFFRPYSGTNDKLLRAGFANATFWIQWCRDVSFGKEVIAFVANHANMRTMRLAIEAASDEYADPFFARS